MKWELYFYLFFFLDLGLVGGCISTQYGCCPNGVTAASGPNQEGCDRGR